MNFGRKHARTLQIAGYAMMMFFLHTPATAESLPCGVDRESAFEGWEQWEKLTSTPVRSQGHSRNWVDIYVDEVAREAYLSEASVYPECARIIKPEYMDRNAGTLWKLTIMVKMPAGYDPDHGDWWYAVARRNGTVKREGRIYDCIACHRQAKETDYTFSRRLEK